MVVSSLKLDDGDVLDQSAHRLNFSKAEFYGRQNELGLLMKSFKRLVSREKKGRNSLHVISDDPGQSSQLEQAEPELHNNTEIVIIRGKSGSGKTRLVTSFRHEIEQMVEHETAPPCFFVKGKSSEPLAGQTMSEPYSSLADALTDLCSEILLLDEEEVEVLQTRILESVSGDVHQYNALCNIVPALEHVLFQAQLNQPLTIPEDKETSHRALGISPLEKKAATIERSEEMFPLEMNPASNMGLNKANALRSSLRTSMKKKSISQTQLRDKRKKHAKKTAMIGSKTNERNRLRFLFQTFLRAVCTEERPLILFMDDLHWADVSTIGLLNLLVTDKAMKHLLLLVTIREPDDEESDESKWMRQASSIDGDHDHASVTSHSVASYTYLQTKNEAFELFMKIARNRKLPLYQPMLELQLGNLSMTDISSFLADLLELQLELVEPLAAVLYRKTAGNIFYTKALLQWLEQKKLLKWSQETGHQSGDSNNTQSDVGISQPRHRWNWDIDKIMERASVSENFVAMVLSKLEGLEMTQRYILSRGALLKSPFTVFTLYGLLAADVTSWCKISFPKAELVEKLETLVDEGLLENCSTPGAKTKTEKYQFSHDKIQEAAALLVEGYERDKLLYTAGMYLLELDESNENAAVLGQGEAATSASPSSGRAYLAGVDHLNAIDDWSLIHDDLGVDRLVKFNLSAAKKSAHVAAFASAQTYLGMALELVNEMDPRYFWNEHYDLCYELHVLAIDVECTVGKIEQAELYSQEVIAHAKTVEEQLPIQWALAENLGRREEHWLALQTHQLILKILGFAPKSGNIFNVLLDLLAMKRLFARHSDEQILALPHITDRQVLLALDALSALAVRAYYCGQKLYVLTTLAKMVSITFKFGISPVGALSFCQIGSLLLGPLKDEPLGIRVSDMSFKMMEITEATRCESKILFTYSGYIEHYTKTPDSAMDMMVKGYKSGVQIGDMEFATLNGQSAIITAFNSGISLPSIVDNVTVLSTLMDQYEIQSVAKLLNNYALLPQGVSGALEDPFHWTSGETEKLKKLRRVRLEQTVAFEVFYEYAAKCQLAYYLGRYELANELYSFLERFEYLDHGLNWAVYSRFYGFMISTAIYRQRRRIRYKWRAHCKRFAIAGILKTKGDCVRHLLTLMDAEFEATFGRRQAKVEKKFQAAIAGATEARRLSHLALANELLGDYYSRISGEDKLARNFLHDCYLQYHMWGAKAKTKQLRVKYGDLIDLSKLSSRRRVGMSELSGSLALSSSVGPWN